MTAVAAANGDAAGLRGALRFARYALAPNRLGYCGPSDDGALFEYAVDVATGCATAGAGGAESGSGDRSGSEVRTGGGAKADGGVESGGGVESARGLRALAQGFEGAWPYLELIAGANGIADPLDDRVVAAYWLGGPLLAAVGPFAAGNHVQERFAARAGRWWTEVAAALEDGFIANHACHVMVVGPWVGMLRGGRSDAPLEVIDRCRIRRARVLEVHCDEACVVTDRISFSSGVLEVNSPGGGVTQRVRLGEGGRHPCGPVKVGDTVAVHWDWVCEVLTPAAGEALGRAEIAAIRRANRALAVPGAPELG